MLYDLSGRWNADIQDGEIHAMNLPGTLDENRIGHEDVGNNQWHPEVDLGNKTEVFKNNKVIMTRYTRNYTWEGKAVISKEIEFNPAEDERIFVECERARCLALKIDENEIPEYRPGSLAVPYIFEITGKLNGKNKITFISDNSYEGLPREDIVYSSMATDETQTNWNGLLGYIRIRTEKKSFLHDIRVYPVLKEGLKLVTVKVLISTLHSYEGKITLHSELFAKKEVKMISVPAGITEIVFEELSLADDILYWDEEEGNLYDINCALEGYEEKKVTFGYRIFEATKDGTMELNGRRIFLRSEANCGEFPETGYEPMEVSVWEEILNRYRSYGVNCVRFHSHCPPEAAFIAADKLGMLMEPELSHWNPKAAFETDESISYYRKEIQTIIRHLANHPSFVMLTLGNELAASDLGHQRMGELTDLARKIDTTRLYATGSNNHYGRYIACPEKSDFYTSMVYLKQHLRGTSPNMEGYINHDYPDAKHNFDDVMENIRKNYKKPVFGFEVGQYEVLPDFHELDEFHGITSPKNIINIKKLAQERGMLEEWDCYVSATGELSRMSYREEVEVALRTKYFSGLSLLGLQDFPGQGTALVGMMNSHMQPKAYPFSAPEKFEAFFRSQLPLLLLDKYTFTNQEILKAQIKVANYGKNELCGKVYYKVRGGVEQSGFLPEVCCKNGLSEAGEIELSLSNYHEAVRLMIEIGIEGTDCKNEYSIWVYPEVEPICPENIYQTKYFDETCEEIIKKGGVIFFTPDSTKESLPKSIQAQFTPDFWSVGTFPRQEGGMGQLLDEKHPVFKTFPTKFHSEWQWWIMATQRAVILPDHIKTIITEMDSYATLRHMSKLFEAKCGNAKIMFSSMGLQNIQQYIEARALLNALYHYMDSEQFAPKQDITIAELKEIICTKE